MKKLIFLVLSLIFLVGMVSAISSPKITKPSIRDFSGETASVFQPFLSILVDKETISLGETATFTIDLSTSSPDNDYTDGTYQVQYVGWIIVDKDGNIIDSKDFTRIYGSFSDTVKFTPTTTGEYALVGLIIQYDQTYDTATGQWITSPEEIKVKEAKKLSVIAPTPPTPPTPSIGQWIVNIWNSIINWFKGLFS